MQLSDSNLEDLLRPMFDVTEAIRQYLTEIHSGYLVISNESTTWFVYINSGQLLYITHSVEPAERLDCHLRRLSRRISAISTEVRTQIRLSLDPDPDPEPGIHPRPDFQGICLLIETAVLSPEAAQSLAADLSREALESLLMDQRINYQFIPLEQQPYKLEPLDFYQLVEQCKQRIQVWQSFNPHIWSPYQRPYLFSQSQLDQLSPEKRQFLGKLLRGFSFRHLAILIHQDELKLVKSLYPLILNKLILLRDPQLPYSNLPHFDTSFSEGLEVNQNQISPNVLESIDNFNTLLQSTPQNKTYRVACIDDSPAMLKTIEKFLGNENLSLFLIQESVKALVEVMRIKPDLILLDVGMPRVDGYELCRLLRKHSMFKATPIIMVTGNTGLIDRAKAKLAGTTDYMTKPFTQAELSKMVFRYLT